AKDEDGSYKRGRQGHVLPKCLSLPGSEAALYPRHPQTTVESHHFSLVYQISRRGREVEKTVHSEHRWSRLPNRHLACYRDKCARQHCARLMRRMRE
ncbi:unnamed protein product, partial [Symbiodinium pilosum]